MATDVFENVVSQLVDLLLRLGSAGCARCFAIFQRNRDVTGPARVFNMWNISLRRLLVVASGVNKWRAVGEEVSSWKSVLSGCPGDMSYFICNTH